MELLKTWGLMFVLLNPFLTVIYLTDVIQKLEAGQFRAVMIRAALIAGSVFCAFAIVGDAIFSDIVQVEFASFQIFGGIIFLIIGLQFVFKGPAAIEILRGESKHLAGAIAMPVLIGPGTISASVVAGKRHEPLIACAIVLTAVVASVVIIHLLKLVHDRVRPRNEQLIQRYVEITGRIAALFVGTIAVEMTMTGIRAWVATFS